MTLTHRPRGPWFQTFTGKAFHLADPTVDEIDIEDIAHALSRICRFGGQCTRHYSVAEHCLGVSYCVPPADALEGLLHDAAEAYTGDVVHPLKMLIRDALKPIELKIETVIAEAFGLRFDNGHWPASIKPVDLAMLMVERDALMPPPPGGYGTWDAEEIVEEPPKWAFARGPDNPAGMPYRVRAESSRTLDEIADHYLLRFRELMSERRVLERSQRVTPATGGKQYPTIVRYWGSATDLATDVAPLLQTQMEIDAFHHMLKHRLGERDRK